MATKPMPRSMPRRYAYHWSHPWTRRASTHAGFRRSLAQSGYLSPNFKLSEAACNDAARTAIPRALRGVARNHAFRLERLRHALGGGPLPVTSWYRTPAHNRAVGGARFSQHMTARATDHPVAYVRRHPNFDRLASAIWSDGGFGQYPGGARHMDVRGTRARWTTFTPGR